jgi:NitT/TauT family transport system substrate-binding protein
MRTRNRRIISALVAVIISIAGPALMVPNLASAAAPKAGVSCPTANTKATSGTIVLICTTNSIAGKQTWIPEKLTSVTLQIDGSAVPYYAPVYAAIDQGFFAENGLKVNLAYAAGSDILRNVAAGNVEFGFPNGDSVVTAVGKGVLVKVVHTTYQKGIGAVLFNKNTSKIKTAADLKGKKIAVTDLGSPNYIQLQVILKAAGLTLSDIELVTIGTGSIVPALQNGQVDAIVFSRIRYYALKAAGFPIGQILSDSYLPSFGNIVVTNPDYLTKNRAIVRNFTSAFDKGIKFASRRPIEAVDGAIARYAPSFVGQNAFITNIIRNVFVKDLWNSGFTRANGYGYGDLKAWQSLIDTQAKFGIIPKSFDAATLVVNPKDA